MTPLQRPERCQILRRMEFDNEQAWETYVSGAPELRGALSDKYSFAAPKKTDGLGAGDARTVSGTTGPIYLPSDKIRAVVGARALAGNGMGP